MFTGIIEGLGKVLWIQFSHGQLHLRLAPVDFKLECKIGDSIAVNGVCLTVEKQSEREGWFEAYASAETLKTTNLPQLQIAHTLNLERALAFGQRLGGHLVSGHVDATAVVKKVIAAGASRLVNVAFDPKLSTYFVEKCSVALDGISLTVNRCGTGFLEVNIIPHTLAATTATQWRVGYIANLEIDLLSKYVSKYFTQKITLGEDNHVSL